MSQHTWDSSVYASHPGQVLRGPLFTLKVVLTQYSSEGYGTHAKDKDYFVDHDKFLQRKPNRELTNQYTTGNERTIGKVIMTK